MIFKCYLCSQYKFWNKDKCYEVHVTSNDGKNNLFKKKICQSCGEGIDAIYNEGKKIAEMEIEENDNV